MKPYRIKHKPTGLYYQPLVNGNNLSKKGKVYLTNNNVLNRTNSFVFIAFNKRANFIEKMKDFSITEALFRIYDR